MKLKENAYPVATEVLKSPARARNTEDKIWEEDPKWI